MTYNSWERAVKKETEDERVQGGGQNLNEVERKHIFVSDCQKAFKKPTATKKNRSNGSERMTRNKVGKEDDQW